MTDREELQERLDSLESRFDTTGDTYEPDEQTKEQIDRLIEEGKESLSAEDKARLNDPETPTKQKIALLMDAEPET